VKEGEIESGGIWVNVNNPSSPISSLHEDILMQTLAKDCEGIQKSLLVGETALVQ
jgi:hypothetical protein